MRTSREYLKSKAKAHKVEIEAGKIELEEIYEEIDTLLDSKYTKAQEIYLEAKKKYDAIVTKGDSAREDVQRVTEQLELIRDPQPQPSEPEFEPFPDLVFPSKLPTVGGLDAKGKKKKQIPAKDLQMFLENVERGGQDGVDWDFGDFWPSKSQAEKLSKAIDLRTKAINDARNQEENARQRAYDRYKEELVRWDDDDRLRKIEYEKVKKESRKVNLKMACINERADRANKQYTAIQMDFETMKEMRELHLLSKDRFKIMRAKQYIETKRQHNFINDLKHKLLRSLDARRSAIDAPSQGTNAVEFERLKRYAEENLKLLRAEIFEIRQATIEEGKRLRCLRDEELSCCRGELMRMRVFREIVKQVVKMSGNNCNLCRVVFFPCCFALLLTSVSQLNNMHNAHLSFFSFAIISDIIFLFPQRMCIDGILARNNFEVMHLFEDQEKLKLMEADRDDRGIVGTVDDQGERYSEEKKWESAGVIECNKMIEVMMAKVNMTEGVCITAGNVQKFLMEAITTKWTMDMVPVRDSWFENSDYERAQRLLHDTMRWLGLQRARIRRAEKDRSQEVDEIRLLLAASHEQTNLGLVVQGSETDAMVDSTEHVVKTMQRLLSKHRDEAEATQQKLEQGIVSLSRECQGVREELLNQNLVFDEKIQVLLAIIGTLQNSVQHISAKMDIVTEERDRLVIASKLQADKVRHQLRLERRHCANLLFVIHGQRGHIKKLQDQLDVLTKQKYDDRMANTVERAGLRTQIWEQIFVFSRLSTDVDSLFEFFTARLANLAGSRKTINDSLAQNGAAAVLAALCKSPRAVIRKWASRALGGMGWDGFVETRILLWDCVMYWNMYKAQVLAAEKEAFKDGLAKFMETGRFDALLNIEGQVEEFTPAGNMSLRTIIKQRRQWALRATRRNEGPNKANQIMINVKDGVITALLELSLMYGASDWEVARNAALAISIASYEIQNHADMIRNSLCVEMLVAMCGKGDAEVQTHAAVTIANLCHKDEGAQSILGAAGAIASLLKMCESEIVDVLEASTCALANITCYCDTNCQRVMEADGVNTMVTLITQAYSENLLDMDQNDEVQANAAEMLANVSRYSFEGSSRYFQGKVVDALILMCASKNVHVRRHAPLVMGNISQGETCRVEIGHRGGVEALFLVLEDSDNAVQANALWALCNLMWHPPNQEHAGRFMTEILSFLYASFTPVRKNAITLLANVLYYNNANRVRFLESEGAIELLLGFLQGDRTREDKTVLEGSLRSLMSLSYVDYAAMWLGVEANAVPLFISYITPPYVSHDAMRYSLEVLANLCVHHENRRAILDNAGIEAVVNLHADEDAHIRDLSVQIIEYLEDVTPADVLARAKASVGLERMVTLATTSDPLVRTIAAESIGEEIWHDPKKQKRVAEVGGVDVLLAMINNADEPTTSLLPALWSLRNLLNGNGDNQTQFGYRDGIYVVMSAVSRSVTGCHAEQAEKILEASLACLASAIFNHERNSRRLLVVGLEAIMDLADGVLADVVGADEFVREAAKAEGVVALAKSVLLMLGPYNFVVCRNCHRKQDLHGTSCVHCGHRLRVEVVEKDSLSIRKAAMVTPVASVGTSVALRGPPSLPSIDNSGLVGNGASTSRRHNKGSLTKDDRKLETQRESGPSSKSMMSSVSSPTLISVGTPSKEGRTKVMKGSQRLVDGGAR